MLLATSSMSRAVVLLAGKVVVVAVDMENRCCEGAPIKPRDITLTCTSSDGAFLALATRVCSKHNARRVLLLLLACF